jgi:peptidoglycan/xylan/chitin deacetylase (PgdA/CDA1 family)
MDFNAAVQWHANKSKFHQALAFPPEYLITRRLHEYYVRKFFQYQRTPPKLQKVVNVSFDVDLVQDIHAFRHILHILRKYGIHASFACIGKLVQEYPREHHALLQDGHEIINHTYTHPQNTYLNPHQKWTELSIAGKTAEIRRGHDAIQHVLGYTPCGFRTPHFNGQHTSEVYKILQKLGYTYSSSTVATRAPGEGIPFVNHGIWEIPLTPSPKYPFTTMDSWSLFRAPQKAYRDEEDFLRCYSYLIDVGSRQKKYLNFFFDPVDCANHTFFSRVLEMIADNTFTVLTYEETLRRWSP